jgi:hypothetical protein
MNLGHAFLLFEFTKTESLSFMLRLTDERRLYGKVKL